MRAGLVSYFVYFRSLFFLIRLLLHKFKQDEVVWMNRFIWRTWRHQLINCNETSRFFLPDGKNEQNSRVVNKSLQIKTKHKFDKNNLLFCLRLIICKYCLCRWYQSCANNSFSSAAPMRFHELSSSSGGSSSEVGDDLRGRLWGLGSSSVKVYKIWKVRQKVS